MSSNSIHRRCGCNSTNLQLDRSDERLGRIVRRLVGAGVVQFAVETRPDVSSSSVAFRRDELIRVRFGSGRGGAAGTFGRGGTVVGDGGGTVSGNSSGVPSGSGGAGIVGVADGAGCGAGSDGIVGLPGTGVFV